MTLIILASPSADLKSVILYHRCITCPTLPFARRPLGPRFRPPHPLRGGKSNDFFVLSEAYYNDVQQRRRTLNSSGDSTQPCRSPCATSNHSECSPSSVRPRARIPSWNWRITVSILAGTPRRVRTSHSTVDRVIRFLHVDEAHV